MAGLLLLQLGGATLVWLAVKRGLMVTTKAVKLQNIKKGSNVTQIEYKPKTAIYFPDYTQLSKNNMQINTHTTVAFVLSGILAVERQIHFPETKHK